MSQSTFWFAIDVKNKIGNKDDLQYFPIDKTVLTPTSDLKQALLVREWYMNGNQLKSGTNSIHYKIH